MSKWILYFTYSFLWNLIYSSRIPIKLVHGITTPTLTPTPQPKPSPFREPVSISIPNVFTSITDRCFESTSGRYTYQVCPFLNISQRDSSSWYMLGLFDTPSQQIDKGYEKVDFTTMSYTDGCLCGTKRRKTTLTLKCGAQYLVTDISEPSTCEYQMTLQCPEVCVYQEELQKEKIKNADGLDILPHTIETIEEESVDKICLHASKEQIQLHKVCTELKKIQDKLHIIDEKRSKETILDSQIASTDAKESSKDLNKIAGDVLEGKDESVVLDNTRTIISTSSEVYLSPTPDIEKQASTSIINPSGDSKPFLGEQREDIKQEVIDTQKDNVYHLETLSNTQNTDDIHKSNHFTFEQKFDSNQMSFQVNFETSFSFHTETSFQSSFSDIKVEEQTLHTHQVPAIGLSNIDTSTVSVNTQQENEVVDNMHSFSTTFPHVQVTHDIMIDGKHIKIPDTDTLSQTPPSIHPPHEEKSKHSDQMNTDTFNNSPTFEDTTMEVEQKINSKIIASTVMDHIHQDL